MTPVALCLEELVPSSRVKFKIYSLLIRGALVISTLFVALSIPFFGYVMALIGSFCRMLVSLVLPCACFLRILRGKEIWFQRSFCFLIIIVGIVCAISGTYSAIVKIVQSLE